MGPCITDAYIIPAYIAPVYIIDGPLTN